MEVNDQQDIENIEFDVIDFKVFKKKTGKVSHQYTINDQPFLHHKVQKSGKSYKRRTRSTASQSSTASSTSHKVQCSRCGRSYGYLPKHVYKPK